MVNGTHCDTCNRDFANYRAAAQHRDALGHWECGMCCITFDDEEEAEQHMSTVGHLPDRYCHECQRGFMSVSNYQQHRNSRLHRGTDMQCKSCQAAFVTASGLAHHLESGSCPKNPGANRESMFRLLSQHDTRGALTNKLIGWHGDPVYTATERSFNGRCYECPLCHKGFPKLLNLDQHLKSPKHASKLYHCPHGNCNKQFVSLAALVNHLESESCGYVRFEQVQSSVSSFIAGGRMLTFG